MIIMVLFPVALFAVVIIITAALMRTAGARTELEQMEEDADQRRYLETWMKRHRRSGCMDNTSGDSFGHNVEPENSDKFIADRRG